MSRRTSRPPMMPIALLIGALSVNACATHSLYIRDSSGHTCEPCDPARTEGALLQRFVLVGDGGEPLTGSKATARDANFAAIRASAIGPRTMYLFLGDNIYPRGLPLPREEGFGLAESLLLRQLALVGDEATAAIVPGNHDWDRSGDRGLDRVLAQAALVERSASAAGHLRFEPRDGCPGPAYLDMPAGFGNPPVPVRVVFYDSEWLLRTSKRKTTVNCRWGRVDALVPYEPTATRELTNADFAAKLREVVPRDRPVILVAHHPLRTEGVHGAKHPWWQNALAYAYPFLRHYVHRSSQDMSGAKNQAMRTLVFGAIEGPRQYPVFHASGHEHGLQVFAGAAPSGSREPILHLVSGAGSKAGAIGRSRDMLFKHGALGFMTLDFMTDGRILLRVIEPGRDRPAFFHWIRP